MTGRRLSPGWRERENRGLLLWGERVLRSAANLTRKDGEEFMQSIERWPVRTTVTEFPLTQANEALAALRAGKPNGAAVLVPESHA